jgi:hypothetical protein
MAKDQDTKAKEKEQAPPAAAPTVKWDSSDMRTTYANAVNAISTLEEVTLFFGTNHSWNFENPQEVKVQLSDRIVLNPFAAKRLWTILGSVLNEYESRFGPLNLDRANAAGGAEPGRKPT